MAIFLTKFRFHWFQWTCNSFIAEATHSMVLSPNNHYSEQISVYSSFDEGMNPVIVQRYIIFSWLIIKVTIFFFFFFWNNVPKYKSPLIRYMKKKFFLQIHLLIRKFERKIKIFGKSLRVTPEVEVKRISEVSRSEKHCDTHIYLFGDIIQLITKIGDMDNRFSHSVQSFPFLRPVPFFKLLNVFHFWWNLTYLIRLFLQPLSNYLV